jgi:adenylate cyclase
MSDTLTGWFFDEGWRSVDPASFLDGLVRFLNGQGFELSRLNMTTWTLHPQLELINFVWRDDYHKFIVPEVGLTSRLFARNFGRASVAEIHLAHGAIASAAAQVSPFTLVLGSDAQYRVRVADGVAEGRFPIMTDLLADGGTDYLVQGVRFRTPAMDKNAVSVVTRKAGGFTDDDLEVLSTLPRLLAMYLESWFVRRIGETLLETYLGRATGQRVLAGQVKLGEVRTVRAALWFSDLRGFTSMSTRVPADQLVAWLNEYFAVVVAAVRAEQGEILKFIGDATMAVFPVTEARDDAAVCQAAVRAGRAAALQLEQLNLDRADRGLEPLNHGVGLHLGDVQYGNIGSPDRLDFTVIGEAVNATARIEGLCGKLSRQLLVSAAVARHADGLEDLGEFDLKGLSDNYRIYGD